MLQNEHAALAVSLDHALHVRLFHRLLLKELGNLLQHLLGIAGKLVEFHGLIGCRLLRVVALVGQLLALQVGGLLLFQSCDHLALDADVLPKGLITKPAASLSWRTIPA